MASCNSLQKEKAPDGAGEKRPEDGSLGVLDHEQGRGALALVLIQSGCNVPIVFYRVFFATKMFVQNQNIPVNNISNHLELSVESAERESMVGCVEDRTPACSNQPDVITTINQLFLGFGVMLVEIRMKDTLEEVAHQASGCPHPW